MTTADIVVVGAHLTGQPLNGQLAERGGVLVGAVTTAPVYRLFALETEPPKPGLLRVRRGGVAIAGERWRLSLEGFGSFVAAVPPPLAIGTLQLEDGPCHGFLCEPYAIDGAEDISDLGGWLAYVNRAG